MSQLAPDGDVAAEIRRRKRLITLVSLAGMVPLLAALEMMRRGALGMPVTWAVLASAMLVGHMAWVLMQWRCPSCAGFVRSMMKKEQCPHCGTRFTP